MRNPPQRFSKPTHEVGVSIIVPHKPTPTPTHVNEPLRPSSEDGQTEDKK